MNELSDPAKKRSEVSCLENLILITDNTNSEKQPSNVFSQDASQTPAYVIEKPACVPSTRGQIYLDQALIYWAVISEKEEETGPSDAYKSLKVPLPLP